MIPPISHIVPVYRNKYQRVPFKAPTEETKEETKDTTFRDALIEVDWYGLTYKELRVIFDEL